MRSAAAGSASKASYLIGSDGPQSGYRCNPLSQRRIASQVCVCARMHVRLSLCLFVYAGRGRGQEGCCGGIAYV